MNDRRTWKPGKSISEIEREELIAALWHFDGRTDKVAESLGVSVRTVQNKILRYDLDEFRKSPGRPRKQLELKFKKA